MKAIVMTGFGDADVLRLDEVPTPAPGDREVRVHVEAVAVARTKDVSTRAGRPPFGAHHRFPHILGTEHAGVVEAVGLGVDQTLIGRRVGGVGRAVVRHVPCLRAGPRRGLRRIRAGRCPRVG